MTDTNPLHEMFQLQKSFQEESLQIDLDGLADGERADYIKDMILALTDEAHEALAEVGWKPWASSRHLNRDAFHGELVDLFHFFMNLCLASGLTPDALFDKYVEKRGLNQKRQEEGYDGIAGKCPDCRRALDDPAVSCTTTVCGEFADLLTAPPQATSLDRAQPQEGEVDSYLETLEETSERGTPDLTFDPGKRTVWDVIDRKRVRSTLDAGLAVGSEVPGSKLHRPVIDIDIPVRLIPSSTPGHGHLYLDVELTWDDYLMLLEAMAAVGIVESGFLNIAKERGGTYVRLPWVRKVRPINDQ